MTTFFLKTAFSTAMLLGFAAATPAALADSSKVASGIGHDLAQKLCTMCHLIEPGQVNPPGHVGGPSFQSIADRPNLTAEHLRTHLRTTHSNSMIPLAMPNPQLTEDELVKIIAYVLSLHHQP
jgi:mono/diheme cytochrome c family protein